MAVCHFSRSAHCPRTAAIAPLGDRTHCNRLGLDASADFAFICCVGASTVRRVLAPSNCALELATRPPHGACWPLHPMPLTRQSSAQRLTRGTCAASASRGGAKPGLSFVGSACQKLPSLCCMCWPFLQ